MTEIGSILQQLLQFSPDALLVVDEHGLIQFSNDTARDMFGYASEELAGRPLELLVPERFRGRHHEHVASFLQSPANREMGARIVDLFARRSDGSEFPAGIRLAPIRSGERDYVSVAVRDMTERRAISAALVAARKEADRANQAKSRFLATASHDLRQPMQAIRLLNASLLKLTRDTHHVYELVRRQEQAIDNATRLLHALLDISRLESGAVDPKLASVSLASVYSDLQREFESTAAAKSLELKFAESDIVLMTDRTLFAQLLQNLIGNAVKYTEHGFVRVTQSLDAETLSIVVEDSGIGIPADKLDRIFDEYYQVDTVGSPRVGVGLGLAIVREVSRLLGLTVSVSSKFGEGTRVRVRIPRSNLLTNPAASAAPSLHAAENPGARRGRLLLLEDNQSVRVATELFLSLEGYNVRSAAGAADGDKLFADLRQGDVLISDYRLDGKLTGLEVLRNLRADKPWDVPAVLLSGDLEAMLRAVKTPIENCRFLSKPVDTQALLEAIGELSKLPGDA
ncbi:MAG: ATP-binding protein [Steroidobacteraceae bacterium]|jgi:PAS domain S-box-containing protein